jgi:hypothetical protein
VTDIIGGSADTGLFLLYAADLLKSEEPKALAANAADRLLEVGTPAEGGLQWAMDPKFPRKMPNFSHGTAGISYFLAATSKREPVLRLGRRGPVLSRSLRRHQRRDVSPVLEEDVRRLAGTRHSR